jgi:alpha-glucosidase
MHTAFNLDIMARPWDAKELRSSIETTLAAHAPVGAPATWVLSNHDVTRPVTRYGRADSSFAFLSKRFGTPTDLRLGTRRARAAALLAAALPGSMYIYQGDELGLPEVEDLPLEALQDPMHFRSGGVDPGRDGCRVPLPWTPGGASFGFSPAGAAAQPWLPQPAGFGALSVEAELTSEDSMLSLYRSALQLRRLEAGLGDGPLTWIPAADGVLAFARDAAFISVTNLGTGPTPLPEHTEVLLASSPLESGLLPPDTTAWLRTAGENLSNL